MNAGQICKGVKGAPVRREMNLGDLPEPKNKDSNAYKTKSKKVRCRCRGRIARGWNKKIRSTLVQGGDRGQSGHKTRGKEKVEKYIFWDSAQHKQKTAKKRAV
jgi:hypothetical protein